MAVPTWFPQEVGVDTGMGWIKGEGTTYTTSSSSAGGGLIQTSTRLHAPHCWHGGMGWIGLRWISTGPPLLS